MQEETDRIVKEYIEWAKKNAIPIETCTVDDIEYYMMRRATAAG